jgi:hypothetical protein
MSGDKRREQILQTAFDLFSHRGFSGTTTKDIAKAAGVSEASAGPLTWVTRTVSRIRLVTVSTIPNR